MVGGGDFTSFERAEFTPDGRRLALASNDSVTFWDLASKRFILAFRPLTDQPIDQLRFNSAGDRLVATMSDFQATCKIYTAPRDE